MMRKIPETGKEFDDHAAERKDKEKQDKEKQK